MECSACRRTILFFCVIIIFVFLKMSQPQVGLESRDYYINSTSNNRSDIETDERNRIVSEFS